MPPSFEYCKVPTPLLAVTVMLPLVDPKQVGWMMALLTPIAGGAVRVTVDGTIAVQPLASLTVMLLYVAAGTLIVLLV